MYTASLVLLYEATWILRHLCGDTRSIVFQTQPAWHRHWTTLLFILLPLYCPVYIQRYIERPVSTATQLYLHKMCIPIICGFPTKISQDADKQGRMCPRCNNAAVVGASSRTWFELFWIPLVPFTKSHIWICSICHWQMKQGDGPDPQPPGAFGGQQWGHPGMHAQPHQPQYGR